MATLTNAVVAIPTLHCHYIIPLLLNKRTKRQRVVQRRYGALVRCSTSDDVVFNLGLVEESVDFTEVEFIEVLNSEGCAIRSANCYYADKHCSYTDECREKTEETDLLSITTTEEVSEGEEKATDRRVAGIWLLCLCTVSYLHCCSTGFSIPALMPSIAGDTSLTDVQTSFLTVGFTLVYALGQIPFGYLADQHDRPKLLAWGLVLWSTVTAVCSKATSFSDLLLIRLSTAASQSMQNPISYGLIPELFPKRRTTALSIYNCALYFGRGVSYILALILAKFGVSRLMGVRTVPFEQFDITKMSLLYITGNQATVMPVFDYDFRVLADSASSWRDLLFWIGLPGLGVAFLLAFVADPRPASKKKKVAPKGFSNAWQTLKQIISNRGFLITTLAAATNDIGFWCLISWQALYYERVYQIDSNIYAPLLAAIIPASGIIGGVGGSLVADWLTARNARYLLTFGATVLGSPLIFMSFEVADYTASFAYLFFGCLFLECWRASSAIMIRESSPPGAVSTAAAVHLFARNLVASVGPLLIVSLEPFIGLRHAITVIPISYLLSGLLFGLAEKAVEQDRAQTTVPSSK